MTRISDLGFQQLLLSGFQRAQDAAQVRQIQLSTGKVSNRYSGIGADAARLISAEGVLARTQAFNGAAKTALSNLQTQEAGLTTVADTIGLARERFVTTLASGSAELLLPELETAAQRILSAFNTQYGGVFVFGGVDGAQRPITASTLADIGGAPNIDSLFNGDPTRRRLVVEEGATVDGGATARELATQILSEFQELANAEAALGPFTGALTDAQRAFLVEKVARFDEISAALYQELGLNGVAQAQAADAIGRNIQRRDLAELVAADIENADIAEVISLLNQDQIAIEASARALAQATQLSLLNFI